MRRFVGRKRALVVVAALTLVVPAGNAGAATNPWPPDGTYHYDIVASGAVSGHSDVEIASAANAITVRENLQQGPVTATSSARYSTPGLALASYSADMTVPSGAQHTALAIRPGVMTVTVPGRTADIKADPSAPLMIVGDNLVATLALTPAILHATGAKSFTLAALQGAKPVVATVSAADPASRPSTVPAGDTGTKVNVAGLDETFWYDPQTFVLDDLHVPDEAIDIRLASHENAAAPSK
ncbi:MAG: hypothetical protein ACLQPV_07515 [Vulcanimicrobiaceae bacterium]